MANDISLDVREYLVRCGLSESKIARCSSNTRLYHDLGIYGEIAEGFIGVLINNYRVDMSGFEFDKFFPPEFPGGNSFSRIFLWIIPLASSFVRWRSAYAPITLGMIDRVIQSKRWCDIDQYASQSKV